MKRIKYIFSLILILCAFDCFAEEKIKIGFSFGTAAVSYGDEERKSMGKNLNRVVLEGDVALGFVLAKPLNFSIGAVSLCDFRFQDGQHFNLIDYAFYTGIRLYPGIGGLRAGIDYMLGRRTDFINIESVAKEVYSTQWGNGFRFSVEYDFSYGVDGFAPMIGGSWRHMPRGGYSDNIFSIFFRCNI
ncbi:MAG: hypothetical protein J6B81_00850 [Spirochaetaceae bacterium]|nr:hypothetical protein [Spirochaetaceae bacterium]